MNKIHRVITTLFALQSIWLVLYGWLIAISTTGTFVGSDFGMMVLEINLQAQAFS